MPFEYKNYGIGESFLPKVYFNKITIDKASPRKQLKGDMSPYIDESTVLTRTTYDDSGNVVGSSGADYTVMDSYKKASNTKEKTFVHVQSKIVFNVADVATFKSIVEDDDFNDSLNFTIHALYKKPNSPAGKDFIYSTSTVSQQVLLQDSYLQNKMNTTVSHVVTENINIAGIIGQIVNSDAEDANSVGTFQVFQKYEKQFPNGKKYFEIPYNFTFELDSENPSYIHLFAFPIVMLEDFDLDISYNFGDFTVEDTSTFEEVAGLEDSESNFFIGSPTFETIVSDSKAQTVGTVFTVANNQSSTTSTSEVNLQREEKFNDIKGSAWFGDVHKADGRYMAGGTHGEELHPFLDIHFVQNRKVVDLRPIKQVKDTKIDFSTLDEFLDLNPTKYGSSNNKKYSLDNLAIFSECFLSVNKEGDISGFFGIDYMKLFRVHGILPAMLDKLADATNNAASSFDNLFRDTVKNILSEASKFKIFRKGPNETKLIYDSSFVDSQGVYPDYSSAAGKTIKSKFPGAGGYLNPVPLNAEDFDLSEISLLEFYTFSDLDKNKNFDTDYSYEIEVTLNDPIYTLLNEVLQLVNIAIEGRGKTLGLKQLITLVTNQPKNKSVLNTSGSPYIKGNFLDLMPQNTQEGFGGKKFVVPKTILETISDYDSQYNQDSISWTNGTLGVLEDLLETNILALLLNSQKSAAKISDTIFSEAVRAASSLSDDENISLEGITVVYDTLVSLRNDLSYIITGLSANNHSKVASGNNALNSSVSPSNTNANLRKITAKKRFPYTVRKTNHGFDYAAIFGGPGMKASHKGSLLQLAAAPFRSAMQMVLRKYYSSDALKEDQLPNKANISDNGYSFLPLYDQGVVLPKRLRSPVDENNWTNTLHSLLLFKKDKLAKMDKDNIFSYNQEEVNTPFTKYVLNNSAKNGHDLAKSELTINDLIKAERNQTLISDYGMNIQDKVKTTKGVEVSDGNETSKGAVDIDTKSSTTNVLTNYFLSYVNNYSEGEFTTENLSSPPFISSADGSKVAAQIMALILYKQVPGWSETGLSENVANNRNFKSVFDSLFGQESSQLFANRFAEYFFTFLNLVRIDYLSDFEKFDPSFPGSPQAKTMMNVDNVALVSSKWKKLTLPAINQIPDGKSLLCRITNHKSPFVADNDIRRELLFYQNFNKYFLINNGSETLSTVNKLGSQLITRGIV